MTRPAYGLQGLPVIDRDDFSYATPAERQAQAEHELARERRRLAHERYWRDEWKPQDFMRPSIPVGHMTSLIDRSGMARPYVQALNSAIIDAAGGQRRGLVSPRQVLDAGMRMGVGYLVGRPAMTLLSKTLGGVANLDRSTQEKLTNWGTLGIMLSNTFLGRR